MDSYVGIILIICVIASFIFFKPMFKKMGMHGDDIVTTRINEQNHKLIKRSQIAFEKLIEECGEDFETPQEIYNKVRKIKEVTNG